MQETPTISNMAYGSVTSAGDPHLLMGRAWSHQQPAWAPVQADNLNLLRQLQNQPLFATTETIETIMSELTRRIVQVFIADPNPNVPLDESVLFKGEQKLTDLTDTELFFEVPIAERMAAHNAKRIKWLDKESTKRAGKDVTLDPVKIRELKMVVVTIAQF